VAGKILKEKVKEKRWRVEILFVFESKEFVRSLNTEKMSLLQPVKKMPCIPHQFHFHFDVYWIYKRPQ
jgi:hypothetical protein